MAGGGVTLPAHKLKGMSRHPASYFIPSAASPSLPSPSVPTDPNPVPWRVPTKAARTEPGWILLQRWSMVSDLGTRCWRLSTGLSNSTREPPRSVDSALIKVRFAVTLVDRVGN